MLRLILHSIDFEQSFIVIIDIDIKLEFYRHHHDYRSALLFFVLRK